MTQTIATSMNGILKINKRGRAKFQLGDDGAAFDIDILQVYDEWCDVDMELREKGEDGKWYLPPKSSKEYGQKRLDFVQAVINDAYAKVGTSAPAINRAEAEEFIEMVTAEAAKLRNFTLQKSGEPSSSPDRSGERINFSQ